MKDETPQGHSPADQIERAKRRLLLNPPDGTLFDDPTNNPPKRFSVINDSPTEVRAVPVFIIDPYGNPIKVQVQNPTTFKSLDLTVNAGATAIWTPATGKRFRLMGLQIVLASGTTAAAASTISITDGATVIFRYALAGAALAAPALPQIVADLFLHGAGYLSTTTNNVLNLNLSSALAVGGVTVNAWGTEE